MMLLCRQQQLPQLRIGHYVESTFLLLAGEKLHIVVAAAAVVPPLKMCEGRRDMGDERGR